MPDKGDIRWKQIGTCVLFKLWCKLSHFINRVQESYKAKIICCILVMKQKVERKLVQHRGAMAAWN